MNRSGASATDADLARKAAEFARDFTAAEHPANVSRLAPSLRAASPPEAMEQLRVQLTGAHGEVREVGAAWAEDVVQGYRRFRVPVTFAAVTLDLRIAFDGEGHVAGFFLVPHAAPPADDGDAPGRSMEVEIGDGETALPGTLLVPESSGPFPAVVLVHGSGPNDRDETVGPNRPFRDLAWGLAERGIASLRYDKRSLARPGDLQKLGDALTVQHEVIDDVWLAIERLRGHDAIDDSKVYVVGHSLGGAVVPRVAQTEKPPAGLIALAGPTLPLPEKMLEQRRYMAGLDGKIDDDEQKALESLEQAVRALRAAIDGAGPDPGPVLGAPTGYFRDFEAHPPATLAAKLGLPILVLQGGRDYQVTDDDFAIWRAALDGKPFACLARYAPLDHLLREGSGPSGPADYERQAPVSERVIDDVAAWIHERRCPESETADR